MRIVIVGGGIASVYLANRLKKENSFLDIIMVSEETYPPYDRIHLCRLVDRSSSEKDISLPLERTVRLELNQKITMIDREEKKIFSNSSVYSYDKLILATGSTPLSLFDEGATFRSSSDCETIREGIRGREVVVVGAGPIGLELLETLNNMDSVEKITLINREKALYDDYLSVDAIETMERCYLKDGKVRISHQDEIIDRIVRDGEIKWLKSRKLEIENPFVIFGIGIKPNIAPFKDILKSNRGILTNLYMQTEDKNIYAVGECAELEDSGFIAGHVKECTQQADCIISHILKKDLQEFKLGVAIDMLKTDEFDLVDVCSPDFSSDFEQIVITSKDDNRVDEYFVSGDKLIRFIGINSNVDIGYIESLIKNHQDIDINYLYKNRTIGERGRLICSCEHIYYKDIEDIVKETGIGSFVEFGEFNQAGRACGSCKQMVKDVIKESQKLVDPNMPRKTAEDLRREKDIAKAKRRIDKFNLLHPENTLSSDNLQSAMDALEIGKHEINSWISMVTANMRLHPNFEEVVSHGVKNLNKIPIVWLELSDCTGNSEAFIKSTNPTIEDLIFDYISLDYHELLMSASGDQSETQLDSIIKNDKGRYILIVEGAVPLAMDGKYLRIGPKGETGISLLKRCAKDASLVLAVGSCALDGGVVSAKPNPTGAVGVAEALSRDDVINLPGCPTNPINIVGTLLSYMMFEELPALDSLNRPLWAYESRVHDDCERRGNYELGQFVKEWGDEGAKKGWCLFEMGCKGPYTNVNCPTMKFNRGTSWPVQAGHGCMGCTEVGFFDKFANERKFVEEEA
jgi:quinone-reactive Ni/Fe-hydrogenase small subunit